MFHKLHPYCNYCYDPGGFFFPSATSIIFPSTSFQQNKRKSTMRWASTACRYLMTFGAWSLIIMPLTECGRIMSHTNKAIFLIPIQLKDLPSKKCSEASSVERTLQRLSCGIYSLIWLLMNSLCVNVDRRRGLFSDKECHYSFLISYIDHLGISARNMCHSDKSLYTVINRFSLLIWELNKYIVAVHRVVCESR